MAVFPAQAAMLEIETKIPNGPGRLSQKMKVTEKDVAYVADLANLELTEKERSSMLRDLNSILDYIDRLNQLDTTDVSPMAQVSDKYGVDESKTGSARFLYSIREDILEGLRKSLPHDVALQNAPDSDGTFFKVPKVIER
jgi:aspartyl-tRNA(Asn)/glutamyl-tRNA(Gln) amidotransferase subunit C